MKKIVFFVALIGFMVNAMQIPAVAQQTETGIKIAVININAIIRQGKAFQNVQSQIVKFRENFRVEIQKEEEALRTANQELARQRTLLSPEAFTEKRQEFEKRVANVQRLVQQRKQNLDKAQAEAMKKIENALNEIVNKMAKEQNISLVLRLDQTVLAGSALHITDEVLKRLDESIPTVKVNVPNQ